LNTSKAGSLLPAKTRSLHSVACTEPEKRFEISQIIESKLKENYMLTAKNLERMMELEERLKVEYQTQLDEKAVEIEGLTKDKEDQKAVIAKQLEQITTLSTQASANKRIEQLNRELNQRSDNLSEKITTQKKQIKALQKDLAEERAELKTLKQFDPAKMKKNLDASKKKLAEKTTATDLLQKSLNKTKNEKAELQQQVKELETKLEEFESTDETDAEPEEAAA
jgi:septal ring factor EnvC (AmiA/AmiB activator)